MDYSDALSVHLDRITEEGGAFTLTHNVKGWTATGTRKGGRKEFTGSGETAVAAVADLLARIRDETVLEG